MVLTHRISKDQFEKLDPVLQGEYKPLEGDEEGRFELDWEGADGLQVANVDKLTSALSKARGDIAKLQKRQLPEDVTLEDIQGRQKEIDKLKADLEAAKASGNADNQKAIDDAVQAATNQLETEKTALQEALQGITTERDTLDGDMDKLLTQDQLMRYFSSGEFEAYVPEAAVQYALGRVRVVKNKTDEGVKREIRVMNPDGETFMTVVDPKTKEPVSAGIEHLLRSWKSDSKHKDLFKPGGKDGSGNTDGDGGGESGGKPSVSLTDHAALGANIEDVAGDGVNLTN